MILVYLLKLPVPLLENKGSLSDLWAPQSGEGLVAVWSKGRQSVFIALEDKNVPSKANYNYTETKKHLQKMTISSELTSC